MTNAVNLASAGGTGFSFRNRIINGDMRIDQRNAGASVTPAASAFTVDRFDLSMTQASKLTFQQVTDAPAGFSNSLKLTVAAQYSPLTTDQFFFRQPIEANNISDWGLGTSNASTVTLSFWAKSSVTGTYSISFVNDAASRSYVATYTINSASTWEYKSVTLTLDTTGTWATGTSRGLWLAWSMGAGSTFQTTAGTWQAGNFRQTSGSINFVNQTAGATWQITGVQLELGSVATPFERRPYGLELSLCQRYFNVYNAFNYGQNASYIGYYGGSTCLYPIHFPVTMRAIPTVTASQPTQVQYYSQSGVWTNTTLVPVCYTTHMLTVTAASDSVGGSKLLYLIGGAGTTIPIISASAEL